MPHPLFMEKGEDSLDDRHVYSLIDFILDANEYNRALMLKKMQTKWKKNQKEFYSLIIKDWDSISQKIIVALEDEFRNWKEEFTIQDLHTEFQMVSLKLPRINTEPVHWEISFDSIHDENHMFTIYFVNFSTDGINIDG